MYDTTQTSAKRPVTDGPIPDQESLFAFASGQGGYFTADQARSCGYSWALLSHHAKAGRFVRIRRGLYRFRDYPTDRRDHVRAAWLSVGKDIAVVSHQTAMDILDLSDVIPDAVHVTVSRSRRRFPSIPGVQIHTVTRPLKSTETVVREGMKVTSPSRTILDCAEAGIEPEQIELAVRQAVIRGQVTAEALRADAAGRSSRVVRLVTQTLQRERQ